MAPESNIPGRRPALTPVAVQILLSLASGPRHGYGIKLDIEERTRGAVSLGSGTLYQALQRLEAQGMIAAREPSSDDPDARRGRDYELREPGRSALDRELELMRRTLSYADAHVPAGGESQA